MKKQIGPLRFEGRLANKTAFLLRQAIELNESNYDPSQTECQLSWEYSSANEIVEGVSKVPSDPPRWGIGGR